MFRCRRCCFPVIIHASSVVVLPLYLCLSNAIIFIPNNMTNVKLQHVRIPLYVSDCSGCIGKISLDTCLAAWRLADFQRSIARQANGMLPNV
jgi:hypothetical protein